MAFLKICLILLHKQLKKQQNKNTINEKDCSFYPIYRCFR